jgi:hypothetical protein
MLGGATACSFIAICLVCLAGCRVEVNKAKNGEDKDVKIATPLGGINVKTNQTSALDVGLPAYPGAQVSNNGDGDKSANVNLGFGRWQLHVKVANYRTSDPQSKVLDFYRKALGTYGTVIECNGSRPVGTPSVTSEGLSCNDNENHRNVQVNGVTDQGLKLKAGSRHHQHIVAFKDNDSSETRFALIMLDLPRGDEGKQETN